MNGRMGWSLALLGGLAAGCGDDATGPPANQFVGTWQASRVEYVGKSGQGTVDVVALGGTATLVLNADQSALLTITPAGQPARVSSGTWSNSIDVFNFTMSATSNWSWDYTLSGGTLTLSGADSSWDFNGDGTPEDATFNLTFAK